jgi:serine phosphatase RsbU (regulator of sigma subunit)
MSGMMQPRHTLHLAVIRAMRQSASVAERDELIAAYREFIREITLRFERGMRSLSAEMREDNRRVREEVLLHRAESREYFERLRDQAEEERRRTDDLLAESRAQRQALLRILDRLDNGGAAPAA